MRNKQSFWIIASMLLAVTYMIGTAPAMGQQTNTVQYVYDENVACAQ